MTVAELIEALKAMPQDGIVIVEGCDCHGDANGCEVESFYGYDDDAPRVLITREGGVDAEDRRRRDATGLATPR
jgi:hypothetical protein